MPVLEDSINVHLSEAPQTQPSGLSQGILGNSVSVVNPTRKSTHDDPNTQGVALWPLLNFKLPCEWTLNLCGGLNKNGSIGSQTQMLGHQGVPLLGGMALS